MSLRELLILWEEDARTTKDPVVRMQLGEKIIKYRGLARDIPDDSMESLSEEELLNALRAGNGTGG